MTIREQILSEIEEFLRRVKMPPATFGSRVANDGKFVFRLRDGADMRTEMLERVQQFIREHGRD